MPTPSKTYNPPADAQIDGGSPVDQTLMTQFRDALVHLKEVLYGDGAYTASIAHTHDGVDSALIEVGPNFVRNGSFESDLVSWTTTAYTGGTVAATSSVQGDGLKALSITSTVLANGGGDAIQTAYTPVSGDTLQIFRVLIRAGASGISAKAEVVWYDSAKSQISVDTIISVTSAVTVLRSYSRAIRAPSTARWCRIKVTGGVPGTGTSVGTIYFDGITHGLFGRDFVQPGPYVMASSDAEVTHNTTTYTKKKEILVPQDGEITIDFELAATSPETASATVYVNGSALGTERSTASTSFVAYTEDLPVKTGDLVQVYLKTSGTSNARLQNYRLKAAIPHVYTVNL